MAKDPLTTTQIVQAAVAILDESGLGGLNMRSLGQRLDAAATAVYWHVGNKDNLLRLAGDSVWDEIELPDPQTAQWRRAAEQLAVDLHQMLVRHPWLCQAFGSHFFYGPHKSGFDDTCLAVYEEAGFPPDEADQAAATVFIFVLGSAMGESATGEIMRRIRRSKRDADQAVAETMNAAAAVAMDFPRLRKRLENSAEPDYAAGPEGSFTFGLNAILDGLERRLSTR